MHSRGIEHHFIFFSHNIIRFLFSSRTRHWLTKPACSLSWQGLGYPMFNFLLSCFTLQRLSDVDKTCFMYKKKEKKCELASAASNWNLLLDCSGSCQCGAGKFVECVIGKLSKETCFLDSVLSLTSVVSQRRQWNAHSFWSPTRAQTNCPANMRTMFKEHEGWWRCLASTNAARNARTSIREEERATFVEEQLEIPRKWQRSNNIVQKGGTPTSLVSTERSPCQRNQLSRRAIIECGASSTAHRWITPNQGRRSSIVFKFLKFCYADRASAALRVHHVRTPFLSPDQMHARGRDASAQGCHETVGVLSLFFMSFFWHFSEKQLTELNFRSSGLFFSVKIRKPVLGNNDLFTLPLNARFIYSS